jgi:hypothetical protein
MSYKFCDRSVENYPHPPPFQLFKLRIFFTPSSKKDKKKKTRTKERKILLFQQRAEERGRHPSIINFVIFPPHKSTVVCQKVIIRQLKLPASLSGSFIK